MVWSAADVEVWLKTGRKSTRQKLIVVDSLAFHFRHDLENAGLRSRALHKIAAQLTALAVQHHLAVFFYYSN